MVFSYALLAFPFFYHFPPLLVCREASGVIFASGFDTLYHLLLAHFWFLVDRGVDIFSILIFFPLVSDSQISPPFARVYFSARNVGNPENFLLFSATTPATRAFSTYLGARDPSS